MEAVEGPELDLKRLTRADMGAYLCIASNGIPSPVSKRIMVHVHCEFESAVSNVNQRNEKVKSACSYSSSSSVDKSPRAAGDRPTGVASEVDLLGGGVAAVGQLLGQEGFQSERDG